MSAADDKALIDAIERHVMELDMSVTLKRNWMARSGTSDWHVTFNRQSARGDGTGLSEYASGGGTTLREALAAAFSEAVTKRLAR